ncbi:GatB/YqeY domain-containing protein [Kineosporia sp. A_224]|uniref:GatB/YqeY domain-containing protein n=1 Tax=Kineosporia sp. A_224 TaxID=1962180 RepID=UPI000B4BBCEE|nr:GatB/YqeY domain-containing protein [Kineosporia sp. A_224]
MSDTPTGLKARMQSDLTEAIRSRDELTAATLRMALTAVRSEEVAGTSARELSEDEVVTVLGREVKKRREAATAFADAGRAESAERERGELAVLQTYLPAQLSDEDLAAIVAEAVAAVAAEGATGMAAMGRVMKAVQPKVAGQAEGGRVAALVRAALAG